MIRAAALWLALASPAFAQNLYLEKTEAADLRFSEAQMLSQAATSASAPIATLAAALQTYEDGLIAAQAAVTGTQAERDKRQAILDDDSDQIASLLATLSRISRTSALPVNLHPNGPTDSLRANTLRPKVTPALQANIAQLQSDLAAMNAAKAAHSAAQETLQRGADGATATRTALFAAVEDQQPLPTRFVADPVQQALISAQAETLSDLSETLTTLFGSNLPNDAVLVAKGRLPQPVTGRVLHPFGSERPNGATRAGITFATPADVLVVAPTAATLLFHGVVGDLGPVAVIEPTAGVTITFVGLAAVYGTPGQIIPAGTPIGAMGGEHPRSDMNLTTFPATTRGGASQALYLEVREGQTLVDPTVWFAVQQQMEEQ